MPVLPFLQNWSIPHAMTEIDLGAEQGRRLSGAFKIALVSLAGLAVCLLGIIREALPRCGFI